MADIIITASDVTLGPAGKPKRDLIAGATIAAGQTVRKDPATGRAVLADNSAAENLPTEIALSSASDGQPIATVVIDDALSLGATGLNPTDLVVQSSTPGGLAPIADLVAGDFVSIVGIVNADGSVQVNVKGAIKSDAAKPA